MAYPSPPEISTSYTAQEQALGDGTLPGQELDVDLAAIRASITALIEFLKTSIRPDGRLNNGTVTKDSLSSSLVIGLDTPTAWATATEYTESSLVFEGFGMYLCLTAHTSGVFATDLASSRWQLLLDLTPPGGALIAANNLSDLPDAGNARANLSLGSMATGVAGTGAAQFRTNLQNEAFFQPLAAVLTSWAAITRAVGFDTFVASPTSANLRALLTDETGTGAALFAGGAMGTPSSLVLTNATGLTTAGVAAGSLTTAAETIGANVSDTQLPTSAAVFTHVRTAGGPILLASKTASASATLDFTEFNNAVYSRYLFQIEDILPATNTTAFRCRVSTDGGASYDSGASDYAFINEDHQAAGSAVGNSAAATYMEITRAATSNSAGIGGICADMHVINAANASARTKFHGTGGYYLTAPGLAALRFFGQRSTAQDTDAIRFFFSSGNIASGTIRMYGIV